MPGGPFRVAGGAAEIDGAQSAAFTVAEAVVGAEGFCAAAAVGGGDVALAREDVGPGGNQS